MPQTAQTPTPKPTGLFKNPLAGLDRPREVLAWAMYDFANQSFTLLIITLLFPIYFKQVVVGDEQRGDALWSIVGSASLALVVIASPIIGALADARSARKLVLMGTGVAAAILTMLLALAAPNTILLAALLFIAANFCYQIGENFLASFLPDVSTPRTIGRVSAIGWTTGYIGALLLLAITLGLMTTLKWTDPQHWRPFLVFAGIWFALGIIPALITLKEVRCETPESTSALALARQRLTDTIKHAAHYRQLVRFLIAFFIYGMGVQTIIYFAGILAKDFGFSDTKLILFMLQITITAGIGAVVVGMHQDRIGAKKTIAILLLIWIASCAAMAALAIIPAAPEALFWIIGNGLGIGLGGIGTASRSMVGRLTPTHKTAEFFGLWGMVYKGAGVVGVLSFGQVKAWIGTGPSLIMLTAFFVIGFILIKRVDELAGVRAKRRTERDHDN